MNYFNLHIGDYVAATAHLSLLEDAIYGRLLRRYYMQESALPVEVAKVARLAGARSPEELEAVQVVLEEFFTLEADGWHNKRADAEIAGYREKAEAARENGRRGGRPRRTSETQKEPKETQPVSSGFENGTQQKANQEPIANNQEPKASTQASSGSVSTSQPPSEAGRACVLMRKAGCSTTNPSHPDLQAALAEGVTPEALADTVTEGLARSPPIGRPFAWAIATARSRNAEGPSTVVPITGARNAAPVRSTSLSAVERVHRNAQRMLDAEQRRAEAGPGPGVLEGHCHAMGSHD